MIRQLIIGVLVFESVLISAQSSSRAVDQSLAAIACHEEPGPPAMAPRKIAGKSPEYPVDAQKAHVEGTVVLMVTISDAGEVEDVCVIRGPAMLQRAAFDAVKEWKYKPYLLNGTPRVVKTQVNVVFSL